ncbi:fibronectin type III domain protein [Tumebacillus sp. BK434]|uniref:fibronectin type III domain-containing protein n=1 Tax=Tumebacillus sp. BK434 TaxID=2512169 RepID=UPI001043FC74|nr:fibronectin type III domain-containing protein [Tumebacillus sp. BK434]TCP55611.1 fibronectin type III domain protein [Tumebacillus sp. BK434]
MQQHRRSAKLRTPLALLTVFLLLLTLLPILPAQQAVADGDLTLSNSIFPAGYSNTRIYITGGSLFPFHSKTQVMLYDASGKQVNKLREFSYADDRHISIELIAGLPQGRYQLLVMSYETAIAEIQVMSNYDPANVQITPGTDRDIRIDWKDPGAIDLREIVIQYGLIDSTSYQRSFVVPRTQQSYTLRDLEHNKKYRIKLFGRKVDGSSSPGTEFTNGGAGYLATDSTPPGELTNLVVRAIPNGFDLSWSDPLDSDLSMITVQYAEHGTTRWMDGFVVAKGVGHGLLSQMNMSKRYDFRFTKTDLLGNFSQQTATNNGYGYTFDTTPPSNVSGLNVSVQSKSEALLTWQDPSDAASTDFHHVNVYIKSSLTDWISVGRVEKGVRQLTLSGLAGNIDYTFKVVSVDSFGNEASGALTTRQVDTYSLTDLRKVTVAQEPEGGLQLQWPDSVDAINFNLFKVYYAPTGTTDFRETALSNKGTRSALLRDLPRGTYDLQFRLFDRHGVEKDFHLMTNNGYGYFAAGKSGGNFPVELGDVRIQPYSTKSMLITWNPASTDGTHVEIYTAERSVSPAWRLAAQVDKRTQRYEVLNLAEDKDYFFKLVVVDTVKNTRTYGVIYDNSGYGFNLSGGDRYPPREVTNAGANVIGGGITVTYFEPTDSDFDKVTIYAERVGTSDVKRFDVARGANGTTIRDLLPGATYRLRITTVDTYGNESQGIILNNNGPGYTIPTSAGSGQNEVNNALLIPETNKLTVRFQDPLAADYSRAVISIKKNSSTSYTTSKTVYKGTNEVTFDGLDANSFYHVRIVTVNSTNKESAGLYLGGTTGIGLQPVTKVTNGNVTESKGQLIVTWIDPTGINPSGVMVEVQARGSSLWSDPLIVQPGTQRAVFSGLSDAEYYKVRLTTLLTPVASAPVLLDNGTVGYRPERSQLIATPSQIAYHESATQRITLTGVNTRLPYSANEIRAKLYTSGGTDISEAITAQSTYSSTRYDVTLRRSLQPGLYKLVVTTKEDGEFSSWIKVASSAPLVQAIALDQGAVAYGYSAFTVKLTGSGFKTGAKVQIDNAQEVTPFSISGEQLSFTMPSGLMPGVHKVSVKTSDGTSLPVGFTVHPFSSKVVYTPATTRTGLHKAELQIKNHDSHVRSGKVLVQIRKNGKLIEIRELEGTFSAYETLTFKLDLGGVNSVYADGPLSSLSIQAFVVDPYTYTPLAEPVTHARTLNL